MVTFLRKANEILRNNTTMKNLSVVYEEPYWATSNKIYALYLGYEKTFFINREVLVPLLIFIQESFLKANDSHANNVQLSTL